MGCRLAIAPVLGVALGLIVAIPDEVLGVLLAVFAGFFLYVGAAELLPEAHRSDRSRWVVVATLGGVVAIYAFSVFAAHRLTALLARYPTTTASASISSRQRGSTSAATTTMVVAGRMSPNTLPWTRETTSASPASTRYMRVRMTCCGPAPACSSAPRMISRQRRAWTSTSGSHEPSGQIGAVPDTTI